MVADPGIDGIAAYVRTSDRDRYIATLFAPAGKRAALFALHAYDLTLREVLQTTTEAHIGLIRLAWWRDAVGGPPIAGQPVLAALRETGIETERLAALAAAYMDRIEGDGSGACGALLFGCAGEILGSISADITEAGRYWQAAGQRRAGESNVEPALPEAKIAANLRPITALAAAARRDFAGRRELRGSLGRQLTILRHVLTGRL